MFRASVKRIIELSPNLPLIIKEDEPVIEIAFILSVAKKSNAIVTDYEENVKGEVGAADLLEVTLKNSSKIWSALYTTKVSDVAHEVFTMDADQQVKAYYEHIKGSRWSSALVLSNKKPLSFLTPTDLLPYIIKRNALKGYKASQLASKAVIFQAGATALEAAQFMIREWKRRLIVGRKVITDRSLVENGIFMLQKLSSLAHDPNSVLNMKLTEMPGVFRDPQTFDESDDAQTVAAKILSSDCLTALSADGKRIITPYDLAIKPFI